MVSLTTHYTPNHFEQHCFELVLEWALNHGPNINVTNELISANDGNTVVIGESNLYFKMPIFRMKWDWSNPIHP